MKCRFFLITYVAPLILVACGDNGLSKGKAEKAIQGVLDGQRPCIYLPISDPKSSFTFLIQPTSFLGPSRSLMGRYDQALGHLRDAGLIEFGVSYLKNTDMSKTTFLDEKITSSGVYKNKDFGLATVRLTEEGQKFFTTQGLPSGQQGSICAGKREVTEIVNWTEPAADASGVIVSKVAFKAEAKGIPKGLYEALVAYSPEKVLPIEGSVRLKKMSDGWALYENLNVQLSASKDGKAVKETAPMAKKTYVGELNCGGKSIGYAVELKSQKDFQVSGVTSFFPIASNPAIKSGCFSTRGLYYSGTGALELEMGRWIDQPPGYSGTGLTAIVKVGELSGSLPNANCQALHLQLGELPSSLSAKCHLE